MPLSAEELTAWSRELLTESPDFPALEACVDAITPLKSLGHLPQGTRVLVRGDTDVTFDEATGACDDDARLRSLLGTLKFGFDRGWVQILYGHRGRDPQNSLTPVANLLGQLFKEAGIGAATPSVIGDWMNNDTGEISPAAIRAVAELPAGAIVLLENTRRYALEQALWTTPVAEVGAIAQKLAHYANGMRQLASVHVNEGFAASNRDLSSTVVPVAMEHNALGIYIDGEIRNHLKRTRLAELVIFSGLKAEKLDDLEMILHRGQVRMIIAAGSLAMALKKADSLLNGTTFAMGVAEEPGPKNKVYIAPERIEQAKRMLIQGRKQGVDFVLPVDFILKDGTPSDVIPPGGAQLDVGPKTIALHAQKVGEFIAYHQQKKAAGKGAGVVFHNGVFGMFEKDEFSHGTRKFMEQLKRMTEAGLETYVGGGEGGEALKIYGNLSWVTHCFTAGGTILKALGTEPIPYLKALYLAAKRAKKS